MASALLARIRSEQPAAEVTWVSGETAAPLAEMLEGVTRVVAVNEHRLFRGSALQRFAELIRAWRSIGFARFTRVFVVHVDARYAALTLPLVTSPRVMLDRRIGPAMNPVPGRFLGDEYDRLFDEAENVGPIAGHWPLARARVGVAAGDQTDIAIVPGGAKNVLRESALRRWPIESYVALTRELVARGRTVTLVGNGDDAWVRPYFDDLPVDDRIGQLTLPQTLSLLAAARAVVSHDTGPMHLARLVRTPLVALFGPTPPSHFIVADEQTIVLWGGEHLACRPCYDGREFARCSNNACVASITVPAVVDAVMTLLSASDASARTPAPTAPRAAPSRMA